MLKEKLFLSVEEQYTGKRKTVTGNWTDDFIVTNITLAGRNILPNLEFSASIYNLFDITYSDPGGEEHNMESIQQNGRTFRAKMTYSF